MKSLLISLSVFCCVCTLTAGNIRIFLPKAPSAVEKTAAEELKDVLKKVSTVTILPEGGKKAEKNIYLGKTTEAAKIFGKKKFAMEEWSLQAVDDKNIVLQGGHRGVLYAAYEFLERLGGVMFLEQYYTYGPTHEPKWNKNFKANGQPSFQVRSLYSYFGGKERHKWNIRRRQNFFIDEKITDYLKKFGLTPILGRPRATHTSYEYTKRWPKDVPMEYFALSPKTKTRVRTVNHTGPGQVCFSHPEVRRLFAEQLEKFIQQDRAECKDGFYPLIYVIANNDNYDACICPKCTGNVKKMGNYSALYLDFMNDIARRIAKKYPDVKIEFSAYLFTQAPPPSGTKSEKNILVKIAQMGTEWENNSHVKRTMRDSLRPLTAVSNTQCLKEIRQWSQCADLAVHNYWITWLNRGLLTDVCETAVVNNRIYAGIVKMNIGEIEEPLSTSFYALRMYLIHSLMNNVNIDAEKEIERFMDAYYGKAAPEMKALRQMITDENRTVKGSLTVSMLQRKGLTNDYFAKAEKLLNTALKKAENDNSLAFRIRRERLCFDRVRLMLPQISEKLAPGRKAVAARFVADTKSLAPHYFSGNRIAAAIQNAERIAKTTLFSVEPLKEFPGRKVIAHFKGNSFPQQYKAKIGKDPDSATGTALYHEDCPAAKGIVFGFCTPKIKSQVLKLDKKKFHFDGKYHWYHIGKIKLYPNSYIFSHWSWEMQCRLVDVYGIAPDNQADAYIKLKAEPVPGKPDTVSKLWMDGVLLLAE